MNWIKYQVYFEDEAKVSTLGTDMKDGLTRACHIWNDKNFLKREPVPKSVLFQGIRKKVPKDFEYKDKRAEQLTSTYKQRTLKKSHNNNDTR